MFLKVKTATYTGSAITMEVEGYIPADVTVRYPNGNSFVNAGTYNVTAICYGDNYETLELSATLIIVKTSYDTSGITFADATYTYDKGYKSISVKGDLPTGVSVSYKINGNSGNSAVNAGTYSVVASFTSTNSNYDAIPDMSATLTINKADYSSVSVTMEDLTVTYDGTSHTLEASNIRVPSGVSTSYSIKRIKDATGANVEESAKDLSVEDKIVELLKIKETKKSYRPEIERMITNLSNLEVDENLLDSNNVYFGLYKSKINISSVENIESYFDEGKEQTINNLLFGYIGTDDSLQAYVSHDSVSYDNLNKIKAFDFVNFIQKNNIDEKMLYGRITNLLKKSEGVIPADDMTKMVKGIQKGLVSYFMVKGYNPEVESQKDLYEIITKPSEALKGIIKTNVRAFEEGNFLEDNKEIAIDNLNTKIEEVENSEKAFNRSIKGIKDKNTLENLKKQEVNRLRLECAKGELPKEYYTKRIANIINGNYKKDDALKVLKPKEPNGWHKFVRYFFKKDAYQDVYDNFASRTKELEKFAVKDFLKESEYCSVGNDEEFNLTAKDVNKGERENIEVSQAEMLNNKDQISKYFEPELDVLKKEAVKDEQVR